MENERSIAAGIEIKVPMPEGAKVYREPVRFCQICTDAAGVEIVHTGPVCDIGHPAYGISDLENLQAIKFFKLAPQA